MGVAEHKYNQTAPRRKEEPFRRKDKMRTSLVLVILDLSSGDVSKKM